MSSIKDQLLIALQTIASELGHPDVIASLQEPLEESHGDYATNLALVLAKKMEKSPREVAELIREKLVVGSHELGVDSVEIAGPGFVNLRLSKDYLITQVSRVLREQEEFGMAVQTSDSKLKILVEFAHPNTHKEFHIGHLRNITVGEAIVRLIEASGKTVFRANYQGDVGMHVAKALYGLLHVVIPNLVRDLPVDKARPSEEILKQVQNDTLEQKAKLLGKAYTEGSKAFEDPSVDGEKAKAEIMVINKKIYMKDPEIIQLWEKTRQWSLDYFDSIYERVGTHFDRFYFESQVFESGKEIVLAHVEDGIFEKNDGAIIFDGEKQGLHKRVFITSEGNPTYEGKEMGLAPLQYSEFPFDTAIHVVGPEQAGYFQVVFKAMEMVDPSLAGKEKHLVYGFVQLKEGKMSSRQGNVIAGLWLLDEAKRRIRESFKEMDDETAEMVAVGVVKYSMLKFGTASDISFSFDESITLEGNSGPYIQYTYARTQSVLRKAVSSGHPEFSSGSPSRNEKDEMLKQVQHDNGMEPEEFSLLRTLNKFSDKVAESGTQFAPNMLCNYLFDLAQKYNLFYQKHTILNSESEPFRLALTCATGQVVKNGLKLLGISAPEKM